MNRILLFIITTFIYLNGSAQIIPNFSVSDTVICINVPLKFTDLSKGDSIISWQWDFGDSTTSSLQNPVHSYSDTGFFTITLKVSDTAGNTRSVTKQHYVEVLDTPAAHFSVDTSRLQPNFYITFIADSSYAYRYCKYSWNFQTDSLIDTIATIYHVYSSEGEKNVTLTVKRGGCQSQITQTFIVNDHIKIPNVFSPNGDNINDVFTIITNGIDVYSFTVYNRWGEIVYTFSAKTISWDGRSSAGIPLATGTYYYVLSCPKNHYTKTGSIFLSR